MKRDDDWNYIYSLAVEYRNKYGNLIIPSSYITEQGVNLGRWISTQRNLYKNNRLSEERVKKLEEIGMVWTVCDQKWEEMYKLAQKYHEENGNLLIIKEYVIEEKKLGSWIYKQRSLYQEKKLSEERIKKLEKIGMVWDVHDEKWEEMYDLAKKYYLKYNNLLIKDYVIINGVKLGRWIRYQRKQYKARKLSEERIKKLEEIGMVWGIVSKDNYITKENELKWEEMYKLAQKYCEENGNLLVPQSYVTCDGQKLGNWICVQRCFYQNQTLNKNREKLLNKIGMIWDIHDFKWESSYDAARKYYEENGNLFVPNDYMTEYGINLVNWLNSQKVLYRDKKLKKERIEKLNQIGIIWDIHESRWEEMYQLAVDYTWKMVICLFHLII